jgi:hypothetical protein
MRHDLKTISKPVGAEEEWQFYRLPELACGCPFLRDHRACREGSPASIIVLRYLGMQA